MQNRLESQSGFASIVKERLPPLGIRQDWLEEFDEVGAFQPIAFVAGGEPPGVTDRTPYEPNMAFREEQPYAPWSAYEWEAWGHPQITALYAPWQVLYIDDVLERCNETLPLSALASSTEDLTIRLKPLQSLIARLHESWATLNEAWTPLMKLLVRVQNRYLPEVTLRSTLLRDVERQVDVEPWEDELRVLRCDRRGVPTRGRAGSDPSRILVPGGTRDRPRASRLARAGSPRAATLGVQRVARRPAPCTRPLPGCTSAAPISRRPDRHSAAADGRLATGWAPTLPRRTLRRRARAEPHA